LGGRGAARDLIGIARVAPWSSRRRHRWIAEHCWTKSAAGEGRGQVATKADRARPPSRPGMLPPRAVCQRAGCSPHCRARSASRVAHAEMRARDQSGEGDRFALRPNFVVREECGERPPWSPS
jgi:uncharacterized ferritin-like protein (DUF455 family)